MNRGSLKTRFISEVDGDDSENLQKNCYVAKNSTILAQLSGEYIHGLGSGAAAKSLQRRQ